MVGDTLQPAPVTETLKTSKPDTTIQAIEAVAAKLDQLSTSITNSDTLFEDTQRHDASGTAGKLNGLGITNGHLAPPAPDPHDGNASDGDGGESILREHPELGIIRETVHPEDHTNEDSKWNLKNVQKWMDTPPLSEYIANSKFRACKIFRESDKEHSPTAFARNNPNVGLVIDISGDTPSYLPSSLETAGVEYRKVATVSKIPPPAEKVAEFISTAKEFWARKPEKDVLVHCHYGWNRTGFMVCSFLIEQLGLSAHDAIAAFAHARPPKGIKHASFKKELHRRYGGDVSDSSSSSDAKSEKKDKKGKGDKDKKHKEDKEKRKDKEKKKDKVKDSGEIKVNVLPPSPAMGPSSNGQVASEATSPQDDTKDL